LECLICNSSEGELLKYPWGIMHRECWEKASNKDIDDFFDGLLSASKELADSYFPPDSDSRKKAYEILTQNIEHWHNVEKERRKSLKRRGKNK
jgi:hypothetical protein